MSSESSTRPAGPVSDSGFHARHFYLLLAMAGATWAVIVSPNTHPAALILLSAAILAAGFAGAAMHGALMGFFTGQRPRVGDVSQTGRAALEAEKALVLRSIKELEFDRAMRKIGDADFAEISGRLRSKAMSVMEDLDGLGPAAETPSEKQTVARVCEQCGQPGDLDARFCKHCGGRIV